MRLHISPMRVQWCLVTTVVVPSLVMTDSRCIRGVATVVCPEDPSPQGEVHLPHVQVRGLETHSVTYGVVVAEEEEEKAKVTWAVLNPLAAAQVLVARRVLVAQPDLFFRHATFVVVSLGLSHFTFMRNHA